MLIWTCLSGRRAAIEIVAATALRLFDDERVIARVAGDTLPHGEPLLLQHEERWLLLAPRSVLLRLNGERIDLPVAVLQDRDEIAVGSRRFLVSFESLARVEPYQGASTPCARCRQAIVAGALHVCCPTCRLSYHQNDELACWTYTPHCADCGRSTALPAEPQFVPEAL